MNVSRGEVHWVKLPKREEADNKTTGSEYGKRRPAVVLQSDSEPDSIDTKLVVPTTSGESGDARYLTWVFISSSQECVPEDSIAMCTQLRVADDNRFDGKIGELSKPKLREIEKATQVALDLL